MDKEQKRILIEILREKGCCYNIQRHMTSEQICPHCYIYNIGCPVISDKVYTIALSLAKEHLTQEELFEILI